MSGGGVDSSASAVNRSADRLLRQPQTLNDRKDPGITGIQFSTCTRAINICEINGETIRRGI